MSSQLVEANFKDEVDKKYLENRILLLHTSPEVFNNEYNSFEKSLIALFVTEVYGLIESVCDRVYGRNVIIDAVSYSVSISFNTTERALVIEFINIDETNRTFRQLSYPQSGIGIVQAIKYNGPRFRKTFFDALENLGTRIFQRNYNLLRSVLRRAHASVYKQEMVQLFDCLEIHAKDLGLSDIISTSRISLTDLRENRFTYHFSPSHLDGYINYMHESGAPVYSGYELLMGITLTDVEDAIFLSNIKAKEGVYMIKASECGGFKSNHSFWLAEKLLFGEPEVAAIDLGKTGNFCVQLNAPGSCEKQLRALWRAAGADTEKIVQANLSAYGALRSTMVQMNRRVVQTATYETVVQFLGDVAAATMQRFM